MRGIARYTFKALFVLTLLLFVATLVLWVRSFWTSDQWWWRTFRPQTRLSFLIGVDRGVFLAYVTRERADNGHFLDGDRTPLPLEHSTRNAGWFTGKVTGKRFVWRYYPPYTDASLDDWGFQCEIWPVAILLAILPVVLLVRRQRLRQLIARGACRHCGYDLRATPKRCPECGAVPERLERISD